MPNFLFPGDCFEVAMNRDKYPEKVPFRLTRMLIKAMEVSGIEGSYRSTCERTMTVLRESRDSLVAMLEAFVHDPLISWRLVDLSDAENSDRLSIGVDEMHAVNGVPIDLNGRSSVLHDPITEGPDEDGEEDDDVLSPESVLILFSRSRSADCIPAIAAANNFLGATPVSKDNDTNSPTPFSNPFSRRLYLIRRQSST